MQRKLKGKYFLLLLFCFISIIPFAQETYAKETSDSLQVVLHKLVFPKNTVVINHEGKKLLKEDLPKAEGLDGVQYSVYDITSELNQVLQKGETSLENAHKALIIRDYNFSSLKLIGTMITNHVNGEAGIAMLKLPVQSDKQAFLIAETMTPENVEVVSDPLILITPVFDQYGTKMSEIHLYPKNIFSESSAKPKLPSTNVNNFDDTETTMNRQSIFPSTGEIIQSPIFIMGMLLLLMSVGLSIVVKRKHNK
ncbi:pilin N-terminal domain-containing protein [Enterococcus sp. UD-01]|jgi:LPXTG-motif cell wall-anchored protein|uniref:pilin N-terminal domain-containing protein n=1 Tax=Enterococcus sp. UD-01 TaxID=3373911 RepID=UPI003838165F